MVNFKTIRKGHAFVKPKGLLSTRAAHPCSDPAFYTAPTAGQTFSASSPLTLSWNTSAVYANCLGNATQLDVYIISPQIGDGKVKAFSPINFAAGTYTRNLDPKWWNSTASIQLQLAIVPTGIPTFMSPIALGPAITVTYDGTAGAVTNDTTADPHLATSTGAIQSGGLPKGSIAAAVLLPIMAVILAMFIYVKISRKKREEKRKRWSQAVDAKMSRISGDWQSLSAKGAQAAIRQSTASGMRMSTVFAQEMQMDMRPSLDHLSATKVPRPSMDTVGTRASRFNPGERASRVSFAMDVNASKERLSTYSMGRASRSFHVDTAAPPVPNPKVNLSMYSLDVTRASVASDYGDTDSLSPDQAQGPVVLSNDDIHHMDIAPALSLMRTGTNPSAISTDDLLLTPPSPLAPAHAPPLSPLGASSFAPPLSPVGMMPMQPLTSQFMSPDQLLRRYAEMRANGENSPSLTVPSATYSPSPSPTLNMPQYTSNGMRNLTGNTSLNHMDDYHSELHYSDAGSAH